MKKFWKFFFVFIVVFIWLFNGWPPVWRSPQIPQPTNIAHATSWYNSSWTYRKTITIDHTKVPANQTNFPILVATSSDSGLSAHAQSTGNDILFTSSDGTTKLNHEIESYTSSTGALNAWVNVPSVSSTADTVLYMYYGNSGASNQQNVTSTWNSNYNAVWHLKEDPSGTAPQMKDSTVNALNGTTVGSMTSSEQVAGKIDGSLSFDGTDDLVQMANSAKLDSLNSVFTVSGWAKTSDTTNYQMIFSTYDGSRGYQIYATKTSGDAVFWVNGNNAGLNSGVNIADGSWHYIVGVDDGTNQYVYVDGTQQASHSGTASNSTDYNQIGGQCGGSSACNSGANNLFINGSIDEVRVSSIAISSSTIATEYNNQNSPSTFITFGAQETNSTVSCSTNVSTTDFGTLSASSVSTASTNASTTLTCSGTSAGCTLYVKDAGDSSNPGLSKSSPAHLIPSATATLSAGTEGYGIQATTTTAGSGGTLTLNSIYNKTGNDVGGLSLTNVALASSTVDVTSREVVVKHLAAISNSTAGGSYTDTITYSCTAN